MGQNKKLPKYKVFRTDFDSLEWLLNSIEVDYPNYCIKQILSKHYYDGAIPVIILELKNDTSNEPNYYDTSRYENMEY